MKKFTKLNPEKSKTQETGGTRIKIIFIIIVLGAVLGSIAPFSHIVYPKTALEKVTLLEKFDKGEISLEYYKEQKDILWEKYQFLGFKNFRRFLFAIGLPIGLFCCSLILIYISKFISDRTAKRASVLAGISFQFTSIYFIIWTLWAYTYEEKDFSKSTYYLVIILSSVLITIAIFQFQKSLSSYNAKIRELISFIAGTRQQFFTNIERNESKKEIEIQKEKFDKEMYNTFEKVVD
ncbi:hypothetical protein [Aquimarina macrocephali]|uniref:hypothetical protein n=1 Tax=Aquimarina macrocephali TaxID=666563 RepID=UPI000467B2EC|nr:hypothetical protein [Aquimarina macrocephali]